MTLYLGVDTGGTYTDAVRMQDETRVVAPEMLDGYSEKCCCFILCGITGPVC
jgi:N-methylhydantoinase A/oxoprolinase/acetone carboxylase beta subunit